MAESTYTAPATYTITFPSLSQSEVKVSIDGVLQSSGFTISGYATSGSGTVSFTSAPASGAHVRIFRDTTILNNQAPAPKADFQSGATIQAADLNNNMDQVLYKLGEKVDEGDISADSVVTQAIRDLNVTTAKLADNAVTAAKIDSNVLTSHATQVTDAANSAATATAAAATATAQATAAATSAADAATEAGTIAGTVATAQAAATAAQAQATASAASAATSASEAAQAATDSGTAVTTAQGAVTSANTAITTANSADTKADTAITTANTADTNATAALSTANTAASDATNAVSTANTASTNATTAVNTANAASATANTADTNASAAVVTANAASATATTADTNASNAVTTANSASATANTADTNAASALTTVNAANTTANTANTTANTALTTANGAVTTANTADTNATNAVSTANSAANAVANAVFYDLVANFAAFPSSPSNLDRIEVTDSTGLQSQSIITGLPASFTGSSDLVVRLEYNSSTSKWQFKQYFAADPEARYIPKPGGTMTGLLTLSGAPTANLHAATKAYVDSANTTQDTTVATNTSSISTNTTAIATKMATAGGTFTGDVSFDDNVIVKGDGTNGSGELTLNCENNSHGIKIKGPPHSAAASYTLTLPNDTGTNGQVLTTNGSGVSSWSTIDLASRLPLAGGTLTGDLTLSGNPTAANHAANKSYVDTEVAGIVDSAPGTLDTLNELAAALGDDPNFATTVTNSIGTKLPLAGGTLTGGLTGTSATFTGDAQLTKPRSSTAGSNTGSLTINPSDTSHYYNFRVDSVDNQLRIDTLQGADKIKFSDQGSATFAGNVLSGGNPYNGSAIGTSISPSGSIFAATANDSNTNFAGYKVGSSTPTFKVTASGSATFAGSMTAAGCTLTGEIAMGSNKITGVADPTSAQDAATKSYVDSNASSTGKAIAMAMVFG